MNVEEFLDLFIRELESNKSLRNYYRLIDSSSSFHFRKAYLQQRLSYVDQYVTKSGAAIWDIGCGYANTAIYLTLKGHKVTGTTLEYYYDQIQQRMEYWSRFGNLDKLKMLLRRLRARYGVYAIKGNEDGNEFNREFYASAGIKLLEENIEKIDSSFYLAGFQKESGLIEDFLKAAPDDLPVILLRHIPKDLEIISRSRVDLQLSGHTHNGQLFPLNLLIMPRYYELAHGIKVKRNTIFAVTCGIRSWDSPVKTAGYSEILFIKVSFRSDINTPAVTG